MPEDVFFAKRGSFHIVAYVLSSVPRITNLIRKHVCPNILKILQPKRENFQKKKKKKKKSDICHLSAPNIDSRYSLDPPR